MHSLAPKQKSPSPVRSFKPNDTDRLARPAAPGAAESIRRGNEVADLQPHPVFTHGLLQPKLTVGVSGDACEQEADRIAEHVMRMPDGMSPLRTSPASAAPSSAGAPAPPIVHDVLNSPGQPLDAQTRAFFGPRLGHDFSQVRVHADASGAASAASIDARAFASGAHIVFGAGQYDPASRRGRHLLAHELAHVAQQRGAAAPIRRYASGEHSQFGQTHDELSKLINKAQAIYKVRKGETPKSIAKQFNVPVEDLLKRNKSKVKMFPLKDGKKPIPGFSAGETIEIPPVLNDAMKKALAENELTFRAGKLEVNNTYATMRYGQGIAMADLYGSPYEIDNDSKANIETLDNLIDKDEAGSMNYPQDFVDDNKWETATHGRYLKLALQNETHFSPSDPSLAPAVSPEGANNKAAWERKHTGALFQSKSGDNDAALKSNAFADHFLTDAFSAGHLFNKIDVMEKFKKNVTIEGPGPLTKDSDLTSKSEEFFRKVAERSFIGEVKELFSDYETVDTTILHHWNIDTVNIFRKVLQGIYKERPEVVAGAVAKSIHDDLNHKARGVEVENNKGDKWGLSGDGTLNKQTLEIGRKAVAQSQYNVLSVFKSTARLDLPNLFKAVWDYVPHPTKAGAAVVKSSIDSGTDLKDEGLINSIAEIVRSDYKIILKELVKEKKLRKA